MSTKSEPSSNAVELLQRPAGYGVRYGDYVGRLTNLLFLEMAEQ